MVLSVLRISHNYPNTHMLYDCSQEKAILIGPQEDLFQTKNLIELVEQELDNQAHREALKEKYISMLTAGGHTTQGAEQFLKSKMPYLFS